MPYSYLKGKKISCKEKKLIKTQGVVTTPLGSPRVKQLISIVN
jgi:hypothetical protein